MEVFGVASSAPQPPLIKYLTVVELARGIFRWFRRVSRLKVIFQRFSSSFSSTNVMRSSSTPSTAIGNESVGAARQRCTIAGQLHRKGADLRHFGVRQPWQIANIFAKLSSRTVSTKPHSIYLTRKMRWRIAKMRNANKHKCDERRLKGNRSAYLISWVKYVFEWVEFISAGALWKNSRHSIILTIKINQMQTHTSSN